MNYELKGRFWPLPGARLLEQPVWVLPPCAIIGECGLQPRIVWSHKCGLATTGHLPCLRITGLRIICWHYSRTCVIAPIMRVALKLYPPPSNPFLFNTELRCWYRPGQPLWLPDAPMEPSRSNKPACKNQSPASGQSPARRHALGCRQFQCQPEPQPAHRSNNSCPWPK